MIALLLLAASAGAYTLDPFSWAWEDAPVEEPFAFNVGSFPAAYDRARLESAFKDGLRAWNAQANADMVLNYGGVTTNPTTGGYPDFLNISIYADSDPGVALARAYATYDGANLVDCDIRFYGANANGPITWNLDRAAMPAGTHDLRHTVSHELGHCIGLAHTSVGGAMMHATTPAGPVTRDLVADDRAGVQAHYGLLAPELVLAYVRVTEPSGDGLLAPGEKGELRVEVENRGDNTAWGVMGLLHASGATVTPIVERLGELKPGEDTGSLAPALVFQVKQGATCQELISLTLTVSDEAGDAWTDPLTIPGTCPPPDTGDTDSGDPDSGDTDPGDTNPGDANDSGDTDSADPSDDTGSNYVDDFGGCGCAQGGGAPTGLGLGLIGLLIRRRR